jgi:hypothetical protein
LATRIDDNCVRVESNRKGRCELCGVAGVISDWPGSDPANADHDADRDGQVLCPDGGGHLLCDDCAAAR